MCRKNQLRGVGLILLGLGYLVGSITGSGIFHLLAAAGIILWGICLLRSY